MKKILPSFMAIKRLRNELNLTQEEFAKKAQISVQYVRSIERGYPAISDEVKKKLARALNISVFALFPDIKRRVDLYDMLLLRHRPDLIIRGNEVAMFKEVLSRIDEHQFEELVSSGVRPIDVKRLIRTWAKELNIEVIK